MTETLEFVDYYQLLSVAETADDEAIKKAIREERRTWNKRAGQADPIKRGQAEQRIRDLAEAERVLLDPQKRRQFEEARKVDQPSAAPTAEQTGAHRDWMDAARTYFAQNNAHSAYYAAREAIAVNGANHEAWSIRANSSFLMGNYGDAEFEFNEAIRLQPNNPSYHFDLAEAYAARGQWKSAMKEYETALKLDPGNPMYRTAIANVYIHNDMPQKALEIMESVVNDHPDVEFFQYYLALALHDANLEKWSSTRNGKYVITSEKQIQVTKDMSNRALGLTYDDKALRASLEENLEIAHKAETVQFFHSNLGPWAFALFVGIVLIGFDGLGVVIILGVIVGYVYTHRMPAWKHNAKTVSVSRHGV